MEFIAHRVNTIEELKYIPQEHGVEVDLRDYGDRLVLQHEPFINGEDFEEYLKHYHHGTLILNIKSERIELKVLELLKKYKVKNYFFLDSSFPMIHLLTNNDEKNVAIRFSEYEGIDTVLAMKGKAKWIWVDCFSQLPLNLALYKVLKKAGFKLCLVSPELQGRDGDLQQYKDYLEEEKLSVDAICTKVYNIDQWKTVEMGKGERYVEQK
ncbi:hypothetical protein CEH05_04945 [Halobacillus halophilus]|uniref:GP-PDE domain-containing protein n=1 Tax=Halobacillus halophilus (strain ATCC 35676 / DSM 2266 / JCM 20832 / KCTC 3685 / LMG 17431 / NBRC 102448 / NCIMB 2269) TaxID=866895 RepID=I0JJM7_HALH3|nr:phosphatidylinositol-specific phospholipase C/glycerophosphodiester phosphodiesterase family protein [Halobacillus halophilus]ASF38500.1 hypothetical protein CEH05_04945 [Halobacillus halophilus]CCG44345.1 conserved hypothetical protein [Halobacillus halophilus DSM 2266]